MPRTSLLSPTASSTMSSPKVTSPCLPTKRNLPTNSAGSSLCSSVIFQTPFLHRSPRHLPSDSHPFSRYPLLALFPNSRGDSCVNSFPPFSCLWSLPLPRRLLLQVAISAAANCLTSAVANSWRISFFPSTPTATSPPSPRLARLCLQVPSIFLAQRAYRA